MQRVDPLPGKVYVESKHLNKHPHGGVRGKVEYRRHVGIRSIIGNDGRNDLFRGACADCGEVYHCRRKEKSKNLIKCPECGFTSFIYKGFFHRANWLPDEETVPSQSHDLIPPRPDEYEVPLYRGDFTYADLNPSSHYGSLESILEKVEGDFYETETLWHVTNEGYVELTPDELREHSVAAQH